MSNTPLGNLFSALNKALDSRVARSMGLRSLLVRATYSSSKNGVAVASRASRLFKSSGNQKKAERLEPTARKDLFDLGLSDDEQMIQDTLKDFVAQMVRPVAEKCSEEGQITEDLQAAFNELGLTYYSVPEAMGGMLNERATVTQMIIAESVAYGDLGLAIGLLTPVGVLNALVTWGSAELQEKYIPPFLEEGSQLVASIAVNESTALFDPHKLKTKAVVSGDQFKITGAKHMIPLAADAEFFLVAADIEGQGPAVFVIEASAAGIELQTENAMGLHAAQLGKLTLKDVTVPASSILVQGEDYATFLQFIKLAWCSMAVGTCQAALDYVIEYCNSREAFGEPITHRQAVAFMIADIKVELEAMRVLTQRAVSRAEQGLDFRKETYLAHALCAEKSMKIGTDSVQLLGGYGYCRDYPVERWYRDLRAVTLAHNGMHL